MTAFLLVVATAGVLLIFFKLLRRPGKRVLVARRALVQRLAERGWREGGSTDKWPLHFLGTTDGIPWSLSSNAAPEDVTRYEDVADEVWWVDRGDSVARIRDVNQLSASSAELGLPSGRARL
jgi:hypothetical protein